MKLNPQTKLYLSNWEYDNIKQKFNDVISTGSMSLIKEFRDSLSQLVELIGRDDYPDWLIYSVEDIVALFNRTLLAYISPTENPEFHDFLQAFWQAAYLKKTSKYELNFGYSVPELEHFVKVIKLEKYKVGIDNLDETINYRIVQSKNETETDLENAKNAYQIFKEDADATLSLLKQNVGKIGVKKYAEIFELQAKEHSSLFSKFQITDEATNQEVKKKKWLGKAQWWLLFGILSFVSLSLTIFPKLDLWFNLGSGAAFTPVVIVHIVSRFLLISLFIFIISFCFKQYRVNMHLYTLNRHRANTLKSFEYLTRGADTLAPETYNAILMQVSKSIYEAGQTGYINVSDGNADLPSIMEMTKIVTQAKGS